MKLLRLVGMIIATGLVAAGDSVEASPPANPARIVDIGELQPSAGYVTWSSRP